MRYPYGAEFWGTCLLASLMLSKNPSKLYLNGSANNPSKGWKLWQL